MVMIALLCPNNLVLLYKYFLYFNILGFLGDWAWTQDMAESFLQSYIIILFWISSPSKTRL